MANIKKFDYIRTAPVIEAYGQKYPIPTKTAALVDGVAEIQKKLAACKNTVEVVQTTKQGLALFIGENEVNRIFSAPDNEIDTDELSALWLMFNEESNRATREVVAKYVPKPIATAVTKIK